MLALCEFEMTLFEATNFYTHCVVLTKILYSEKKENYKKENGLENLNFGLCLANLNLSWKNPYDIFLLFHFTFLDLLIQFRLRFLVGFLTVYIQSTETVSKWIFRRVCRSLFMLFSKHIQRHWNDHYVAIAKDKFTELNLYINYVHIQNLCTLWMSRQTIESWAFRM